MDQTGARRRLAATASALAMGIALGWSAPAKAAPVLAANPFVRGAAQVDQQQVAGGPIQTTVSVSAGKTVIDWTSFNVANGETVTFTSNGANPARDVVLNRIGDANLTTINGTLTGNTGVWLFAPGGLLFGGSSQVNLPAFVATTGKLSDDDVASLVDTPTSSTDSIHFSAGLSPSANAITINQGAALNVSDLLVLNAQSIVNNGTISRTSCLGVCTPNSGAFLTTAEGLTVSYAFRPTNTLDSITVTGTAPRDNASSIVQGATGTLNGYETIYITAPISTGSRPQSVINLSGVVTAPSTSGSVPHITISSATGDLSNATLTAKTAATNDGQVDLIGAGTYGKIDTNKLTYASLNAGFAEYLTFAGDVTTTQAINISNRGNLEIDGKFKADNPSDPTTNNLGITLSSAGSTTLNGQVAASGAVSVTTTFLALLLGSAATVTSNTGGLGGGLTLVGETGIVGAATSQLTASSGESVTARGGDSTHFGDVTLGGVTAGALSVTANSGGSAGVGNITFAGAVSTPSVTLNAPSDITVADTGSLTSTNASLSLSSNRDFTINGTVSAPSVSLIHGTRNLFLGATGRVLANVRLRLPYVGRERSSLMREA